MPSPAAALPTTKRIASNPERQSLPHRRVEDEEVKPYVIVSDLGKGSFATVYRGYHEVRLHCLTPKAFTDTHPRTVGDTCARRHQDCQSEWPQSEAL